MFSTWSFKTKLQTILGLLGFTALAISSFLSYELYQEAKHGKMLVLETAIESISDKVDRNLFERYGDVQAFALSEPARSGDPARISKFMNDMMAAYAPIYDVMLVLDKKGNVIAVNEVDKAGKALAPSKILGKNYSDQDWFKAAVEDKIKPGQAHFTDLRKDDDTAHYASTDGKVMIFTVPIRDSKTGEILGVWSNRMSWKDVIDDTIVKESKKLVHDRITSIFPFLVDKDSKYLYNNNESKILVEKDPDVGEFLNTKRDSWTRGSDDEDEIKGASIEAFTHSKGFSSYPGNGWIYILRAPENDSTLTFTLYSSVAGLIFLLSIAFLAVIISRRAGNSLEQVIVRLKEGAAKVASNANEVTNSAHSLSESSTEQASALQETAASIEEINAMIKKSNENSARSQEVAGQSSEIAKRGQQSVEEMSRAINEINISNEAILKQISESNSQISDIARVIAEIGNKTKVINDIVFQTKLLSFNASVEAARAGEHGKGFAVVAEEVGNLAQMSGNAAKEISEMLAESIKNVESTVNDTKTKVEKLILEGRQKVQSGIVIAEQCGLVLKDVVANVDELNSMVAEISVASHEQSQGVNEITKAMNELDKTTHANATTSQQVSGYAQSLSQESVQMNDVVGDLLKVVVGHQKNSSASVAPVEVQKESNLIPIGKKVSVAEVKVKKFKKSVGDSTPSVDDPRFKDV